MGSGTEVAGAILQHFLGARSKCITLAPLEAAKLRLGARSPGLDAAAKAHLESRIFSVEPS
jgi:hypothetical protein